MTLLESQLLLVLDLPRCLDFARHDGYGLTECLLQYFYQITHGNRTTSAMNEVLGKHHATFALPICSKCFQWLCAFATGRLIDNSDYAPGARLDDAKLECANANHLPFVFRIRASATCNNVWSESIHRDRLFQFRIEV